ncbi:hypothetical protein Poli38472_002871 [Pythium oligandrum]|uniref:Uncharacterized protein n=1 Tax=Pythium oligandrum TaxID=41045 RepID=A0A8K1C5H3_PYTOL|nr:hypothetical protein Poli38472_002871 [Pythium oligandrum]|eukprot:TMW56946.1 hypothetical protein Poli38472_002871 [Pythium oligandrum]
MSAPAAAQGGGGEENGKVRDLYNALRTGEHGVSFEAFLCELYFLQHRTFTLFDIKDAFLSSTGTNERFLSYRDFQYALTKTSRAKYMERDDLDCSNAELMVRLLDEITSTKTKSEDDEARRIDSIRHQITKRGVLDVLEIHMRKLVQSFQLYGKDNVVTKQSAHHALDTSSAITINGFVDFLNAYFEYEAYFSFKVLEEMGRSVAAAFSGMPVDKPKGSDMVQAVEDDVELIFPQFIELFCRTAAHFHTRSLEQEGAQLRRAIESCRLEFSIELLMEHMKIRIFDNQDDSKSNTKRTKKVENRSSPEVVEYEEGIEGLSLEVDPDTSMRSMESILQELRVLLDNGNTIGTNNSKRTRSRSQSMLFARLPPRKPIPGADRSVPVSSQFDDDFENERVWQPPDVTLIREVIAPPSLPSNILKRLQYALTYQNSNQFNMALGALHSCRKQYQQWRGSVQEETEVKVYFSLMIASVYDSARKDLRAMAMYLEALRHSSLLPLQHSGRALVKSCLGCILYYLGELPLARKCHERVLFLRKSNPACGEEHVDTATAMNNLACCLSQDQNGVAIEEAYLLLKASKRIYLETFGSSHPRVELVTRNFERVLDSQRMIVVDPVGALARGEYIHVIPGSRFQIKALVPVEKPTTLGKKKKKGAKGKGKGGKKKK